MVIPKWLSSYISERELTHLEGCVQDIENCTEAEIIPVIVRSSSNYFQTRITLILSGLLFFAVLWDIYGGHTHWDAFYQSATWAVAGIIAIFFLLPLLAKNPVVQRLATVRAEELEQCYKRARLEFYENSVHKTKDGVGVLIFVSLLEHVVIVLADKKISQTLPPDTWQKVVDEIVKGIKQKKMGEGLENGLAACSDLLIKNFPVKMDDKDELPNKVIIKE